MDETRRRDPTAGALFFPFAEYLSLSDEERVGKRIAPEGCQPLIKKPFGLRRRVILSSSPCFYRQCAVIKTHHGKLFRERKCIVRGKVSRRETSHAWPQRKIFVDSLVRSGKFFGKTRTRTFRCGSIFSPFPFLQFSHPPQTLSEC